MSRKTRTQEERDEILWFVASRGFVLGMALSGIYLLINAVSWIVGGAQ